ncbi:unnamed protein product [Vitrella brassicaformis CCMP3155]|uniref:C3H1-type domain-containing protein n=2 Tax=Vitrella brassicaformis TaxID=1169539 RepID=A0A0G4FBC6_VITBC|nr:unnamed protein product [Vitrella brassicaformis CCMP3155]|eukprot:CEM10264.1 unnamed protein product [Vitrella brassicaformis CCMP3155]
MDQFYKTKMCPHILRGSCVRGQWCTYAHSPAELNPLQDLRKTKLCEAWLHSVCHDLNCKFAHGEQELRCTDDYYKTALCKFWKQGSCPFGLACRHAHGIQEVRTRKYRLTEGQKKELAVKKKQKEYDRRNHMRANKKMMMMTMMNNGAANNAADTADAATTAPPAAPPDTINVTNGTFTPSPPPPPPPPPPISPHTQTQSPSSREDSTTAPLPLPASCVMEDVGQWPGSAHDTPMSAHSLPIWQGRCRIMSDESQRALQMAREARSMSDGAVAGPVQGQEQEQLQQGMGGGEAEGHGQHPVSSSSLLLSRWRSLSFEGGASGPISKGPPSASGAISPHMHSPVPSLPFASRKLSSMSHASTNYTSYTDSTNTTLLTYGGGRSRVNSAATHTAAALPPLPSPPHLRAGSGGPQLFMDALGAASSGRGPPRADTAPAMVPVAGLRAHKRGHRARAFMQHHRNRAETDGVMVEDSPARSAGRHHPMMPMDSSPVSSGDGGQLSSRPSSPSPPPFPLAPFHSPDHQSVSLRVSLAHPFTSPFSAPSTPGRSSVQGGGIGGGGGGVGGMDVGRQFSGSSMLTSFGTPSPSSAAQASLLQVVGVGKPYTITAEVLAEAQPDRYEE